MSEAGDDDQEIDWSEIIRGPLWFEFDEKPGRCPEHLLAPIDQLPDGHPRKRSRGIPKKFFIPLEDIKCESKCYLDDLLEIHLPEVPMNQTPFIVSCSLCGRTIRYTKDDIWSEREGASVWMHLECPGCGCDNLDPDGKVESPNVPEEVMAAGERIARYRSGRTAKEVWGSRGRPGFSDDLLIVAEYYLRSLGLEV